MKVNTIEGITEVKECQNRQSIIFYAHNNVILVSVVGSIQQAFLETCYRKLEELKRNVKSKL